MNYIRLNKLSQVPLYLQIRDAIRQAILDGTLKNHEQLPTEESICGFFSVSRPVVRQAYQSLMDEGLVQRQRGRGTFVTRKVLYTNLPYIRDFDQELLKRGIEPSHQFLSLAPVHADSVPGLGDTSDRNKDFYHISRLRRGDNLPLMLDNFFVPAHIAPDLLPYLEDYHSFRKLLNDICPIDDAQIRSVFNAVRFDDIIADQLELEVGAVGFQFRNWCYTPEGELFLYMCNYFPGDRHQLELDLTAENL